MDRLSGTPISHGISFRWIQARVLVSRTAVGQVREREREKKGVKREDSENTAKKRRAIEI